MGSLCLMCDDCMSTFLTDFDGTVASSSSPYELERLAIRQGWKMELAGCPEEGRPFYNAFSCPDCQKNRGKRRETLMPVGSIGSVDDSQISPKCRAGS
jgi:hypothetical protein